MAHGDQIRGLLRPHHPGHLGDGQHIPLGNRPLPELFEGLGLKEYRGLRRRETLGGGLRPDIDHPCPPRLVEMRKLGHSLRQISWLPRVNRRIIGAGENGSQEGKRADPGTRMPEFLPLSH